MGTKTPLVFVETSAGRVEIVFGVNGWVSVACRGASTQAQAGTPVELARLLARVLHVPGEEAEAAAREAWAARPKDASLPDVHASDGLRRAAALSSSGVLLVFATLFAVLAVVAAAACSELRDRGDGDEGPIAAASPVPGGGQAPPPGRAATTS